MIDWHSHILPGMDDGSRDKAESQILLRMLSEQGVTTAIATPHFYADRESLEDFLTRRAAAWDGLLEVCSETSPRVLCGAEVRYYPGISRLSELKRLCVEGTELLLLEMPGSKWTEYTVRELEELASRSHLTLILAHIERYMGLQSETTQQRLYASGILMQMNAGSFLPLCFRHKAVSMLHRGEIHLIGSDCHDVKARPPQIGEAMRLIRKKLGEPFVAQLNERGRILLGSD